MSGGGICRAGLQWGVDWVSGEGAGPVAVGGVRGEQARTSELPLRGGWQGKDTLELSSSRLRWGN